MSEQTEMNFDAIQQKHNNVESQLHYETHRDHFNNQCSITFDALMRGERLTGKMGLLVYDIAHLAKRINVLIKQFQVPIIAEFPIDEHGKKKRFKEYYITKENIKKWQVLQAKLPQSKTETAAK